MNLVDYSSSDDEERKDVQISAANLKSPKETLSIDDHLVENSKNKDKIEDRKPKKKSKKLDITFLPAEIQKALVRKQSNNESGSDSDDEYVSSKTTNLSDSKNKSSLIAALPPPKLTSEARISGVKLDRPILHSDKPHSKSMDPKSSLNYESFLADDDSHDEATESKMNFPSIPKSEGVYSSSYSTGGTILPNSTPAIKMPNVVSAPPTIAPHIPKGPTTTIGSTNNFNYNQTINNPQYKEIYETEKKSRKRDRIIEQELMQGNLSVVDTAKIVEIEASQEPWDSSKYGEQQKREMQLQSVFNFGQKGGEKLISQPTKVQSRKHQINSLALHAAEMELELMEARGARSKTKSETQAKYGW